MPKALIVALIAMVFAVGTVAGARAQGTQVCNQKPRGEPGRNLASELWFAVGFNSGGNWYSEGWWKAGRGECKTIYSMPGRKFYLSVWERNPANGQHYEWPGDYVFCAHDKNYDNMPAANCGSGFRKIDFFEDSEGPSTNRRSARAKTAELTDGSRIRLVYLYVH